MRATALLLAGLGGTRVPALTLSSLPARFPTQVRCDIYRRARADGTRAYTLVSLHARERRAIRTEPGRAPSLDRQECLENTTAAPQGRSALYISIATYTRMVVRGQTSPPLINKSSNGPHLAVTATSAQVQRCAPYNRRTYTALGTYVHTPYAGKEKPSLEPYIHVQKEPERPQVQNHCSQADTRARAAI